MDGYRVAIFVLLGGLALILWRRRLIKRLQNEHERAVQRQVQQHRHRLSQETARSDALINSMVEGLLLLDANGRVLMANAAMERLFHLGRQIRGRTVMEALRLHQVQELVQRTLVEGRVLQVEIAQTALGGADRHFLVNSACVTNADGAAQDIVLVFHDITRLKLLEETRKEFVANVSHELRTPLSIIKGYAETLATLPPDPESTLKFAGIIERHSDRLTLLVEDLLTIAGLESGQMAISWQDLELQRLTQRVIDELESKAEARGVTLENTVPAGLGVSADLGRLQQVLTNLLDNAIKYGREDGKVWVEAYEDRAETVISVNDNGPGIPAEARERVFERFFRVDKARSRDQGGTGLGLSIVKHIVQAHGGRVWVEASKMGGAKFCLTIPAAKTAVVAGGPGTGTKSSLAKVLKLPNNL